MLTYICATSLLLIVIYTAARPETTPTGNLQASMQIDTVNSPSNERRGIAFLAKLLKKAAIEFKTVESRPVAVIFGQESKAPMNQRLFFYTTSSL
jgi:hypothetical protein